VGETREGPRASENQWVFFMAKNLPFFNEEIGSILEFFFLVEIQVIFL